MTGSPRGSAGRKLPPSSLLIAGDDNPVAMEPGPVATQPAGACTRTHVCDGARVGPYRTAYASRGCVAWLLCT